MCSLDVSVLVFSHFFRTQQVHNLDNMRGKEMTHHLHKLREHYQQNKYLKEYWYFINFTAVPPGLSITSVHKVEKIPRACA